MPYFECKCGHLLHEDEVPESHVWQLIGESQIEKIMEEPEFKKHKKITLASVLANSGQLVRCPNCERVWLFEESMSSGAPPLEMLYVGVDERQTKTQEVPL